MTVPIGAWLVLKELQFAEETSLGVLPGSPVFTPVGYEPRVLFRVDPKMLPILQPGSEDVQTIQGGDVREITWDVIYRPTDTTFAKYGINSQGGGSGTIDKSFTLLMSAQLSATTETWIILNGCRPDITNISGRAGGNLEIRITGNSQSFPVPVQSDPGFTPAKSSTLQPIQLKDGGLTPLVIGGNAYDVSMITVNVQRNIDIIPQPGSQTPLLLQPRNRTITGLFGICWETTTLLSTLGTQTAPLMVWTLSTALGSSLTVNSTQFTKLNSFSFSMGEPAILEAYSFQASGITLV